MMNLKLLLLSFALLSCAHQKQVDQHVVDNEHGSCEENISSKKSIWAKEKLARKFNRSLSKRSRKVANVVSIESTVGSLGCHDLTAGEIRETHAVIERFGGTVENPYSYEESVEGLQFFLQDSGVNTDRFSASEMVTPNHPSTAKRFNYSIFLPKRCRWINAAAQALIAMEMRELVATPIKVRNWWRPGSNPNSDTIRNDGGYNRAVDGSKKSDHLRARGFDLDFVDHNKRLAAQKWLCDTYKEQSFPIRVGIGARTLHIGVSSPNVAPFWTYNFRKTPKRLKGDNCWNRNRSTGLKGIYVPGGKLAL